MVSVFTQPDVNTWEVGRTLDKLETTPLCVVVSYSDKTRNVTKGKQEITCSNNFLLFLLLSLFCLSLSPKNFWRVRRLVREKRRKDQFDIK